MIYQSCLTDLLLYPPRIIGVKAAGMAPLPKVVIIATWIDIAKPRGRALLAHEFCHQRQMRRYGYLRFAGMYVWQFLRHGYRDMPLENEARAIQRQCLDRLIYRGKP